MSACRQIEFLGKLRNVAMSMKEYPRGDLKDDKIFVGNASQIKATHRFLNS